MGENTELEYGPDCLSSTNQGCLHQLLGSLQWAIWPYFLLPQVTTRTMCALQSVCCICCNDVTNVRVSWSLKCHKIYAHGLQAARKDLPSPMQDKSNVDLPKSAKAAKRRKAVV